MNGDALIALTVGFPPLAGLLCYALNNKTARRLIIALTAVVLIGSSILLYQDGGFEYEPAPIFENVVLVLDLALLVYFLYAGLKNSNWLVIGLAVLQLVPIAYFEFVLGGMAVAPMIVVTDLSIVMSLIISIVGSLIVKDNEREDREFVFRIKSS